MTNQTPRPITLITGASRGIGAACVRQLQQADHQLILVARDEAALATLATPDDMVIVADLNDESQIFACFQQVQQHFGRLDHLINAAGVMQDSPLMLTKSASLAAQLQINVTAAFLCCQLGSRLMLRQKRGNIVNFGSKVGESGSSGQTAYCASKAAVSGLSKALAKELGPQGVRVNVVAPGFIDTALTAHYSETQRTQLVSQTALRRLGTAADVAAVVGFLCSDAAAYVTGQVLAVDGGLVI
jgi:3-oxoacyl-[acyl-carrier protein] reductase